MRDIPRLCAGLVGAQFWSTYTPAEFAGHGAARAGMEEGDIVHRMIARYPETFELARTADDIERIHRAGKVPSLLGLEGSHMIENSLGLLRAFRRDGVAYMTLTHNGNTDWADAATDRPVHGGLTPFGEETDDIARAVAGNDGVILVNFYLPFISRAAFDYYSDRDGLAARLRDAGLDAAMISDSVAAWERAHPLPVPDVAVVADHIEHFRDVAGPDHVGIGSDLDGIDVPPRGLEDVSTFPNLIAELLRRGWSDEDAKKVMGQNVLRVMRAAEAVATRLRRERSPSTAQIEILDRWTESPRGGDPSIPSIEH